MDRAQKKHLKELRRKKKLSARMPDQDAFPWKLDIKFHQAERSKMSEFQKTAYDNFDVKKALRTLNKAGKLKYIKQLKTTEDGLTLGDLLFQQLYEQKSIIAPYLVPYMSYGYYSSINTLEIEVNIFTPLTFQDKELGNLYYFQLDVEYEGKKLPLFYTAHALDRLAQRCNMKANELDLHFWGWLLPVNQKDCRFEKIDDTLYFIHTFKQTGFSVYFPIKVKDNHLIAKTALTPGINPCPKVKGDFTTLLAQIKQEFDNDQIKKTGDRLALRKKHVAELEKDQSIKTSSDTSIVKTVLDDIFVPQDAPKIMSSSIIHCPPSKMLPLTLI